MITRYHVTSFDVTSSLDETFSKPLQTLIEFYYDNQIPVDIPKLKIFLNKYIRFVDNYFVTVEDGKIIICIIFRKKKNPIDFGFEFSLN